MRRSVETSRLLEHRVKNVVPDRVQDMQMVSSRRLNEGCLLKCLNVILQAILEKNFAKFAELTMRDSNQFHAICLDTYPPLFYMNNTSQAIIQLVHRYNELRQATKVTYQLSKWNLND